MVVVVLTAGGALIALTAYNRTKAVDSQRLDRALFSIKQQAGVMAAICTAVFGIISALQSAKLAANPANVPMQWGKRRLVDTVDEVTV